MSVAGAVIGKHLPKSQGILVKPGSRAGAAPTVTVYQNNEIKNSDQFATWTKEFSGTICTMIVGKCNALQDSTGMCKCLGGASRARSNN